MYHFHRHVRRWSPVYSYKYTRLFIPADAAAAAAAAAADDDDAMESASTDTCCSLHRIVKAYE